MPVDKGEILHGKNHTMIKLTIYGFYSLDWLKTHTQSDTLGLRSYSLLIETLITTQRFDKIFVKNNQVLMNFQRSFQNPDGTGINLM